MTLFGSARLFCSGDTLFEKVVPFDLYTMCACSRVSVHLTIGTVPRRGGFLALSENRARVYRKKSFTALFHGAERAKRKPQI